MEWILLSILSTLFFSIGNVFDKVIIIKYFKSVKAYFYLNVTLYLIYLIFFLKTSLIGIRINIIILTIFSGIVHMFAIFFYVKAISMEDISKVIIIVQLIPVVILILASIFLGEILTNTQILSFFITLIGSMIISFQKFKPSKALPYILLLIFAIAINNVIMKYSYNFIGTYQGLLLNALGHFIFPILFLFDKEGFKELKIEVKKFDKTKLWIFVPTILGLFGNLFSYAALDTEGPVSRAA